MEVFRSILFFTAAFTSVGCTLLLLRAYARSGVRLLFWTGMCFVCLSVNNIALFVDLILLPTQVDLRLVRGGAALAGIACLLYAFIWESE